jgi:NADH dehydrogenase (ubiquinone) 1 alpha subcomplex subunit 2
VIPRNTAGDLTMASKYAFGQGLKELRFLFCQTSEHSAPVR